VLAIRAKRLSHHVDQFKNPGIADTVKDPVRVFSGSDNALVTQYCEVLGNVALRSADGIDYFLHTEFLIREGTKDF
jgi:hypothetical protein